MDDFKNAWKKKSVFDKQLLLNKKELDNSYPEHWQFFLSAIEQLNLNNTPTTLRDIGCGCGAYSELISRHHPYICYIGYDYSEEAIHLARQTWPKASFETLDYKEFTPLNFENGEIMHASGLHNILPNGDECMDFLLSLNPKCAIFERLLLTDKQSYCETYLAYDEITTYYFFHNRDSLFNMFKKYQYEITETSPVGSSINVLLRK